MKKIQKLTPLEIYKLETKIKNFDLPKNMQIKPNQISKNWIGMGDSEKNYYEGLMGDNAKLMELYHRVENLGS